MFGGRSFTEDYGEIKEHTKYAKECMERLCQKIAQDISLGTMSATSRKCFENLESLFHGLPSESQERRNVGDIIADMGAAPIFMEYSKILRQNRGLFRYNSECFVLMRRVFWSYTNASETLRVECGKTGMLSELTSDLISHQDIIFADEDDQVPEVISASLAILHNCAKAEDNLRYLREGPTVQAIRPYSEQEKFKFVKMTAVLILSYIMKDVDKESIGKSMIDFILEKLRNAVSSTEHQYDGFSAEELVDGLSHLATNESNKILILESDVSILDILVELMENGREEEKNMSVNAVWTLSFGENETTRVNKISSHPKIIPLLEDVEKSALPFKQSAAGALWELRKPPRMPIREVQSDSFPFIRGDIGTVDTVAPTNKQDTKHIMISYNHSSSKDLARKICDRLLQLNYRVWIDFKDIQVKMFDAMAKGVENSAMFLMCMTQRYKDSKFCQSEAEYAYNLSIPIMPILAETDFKPDGWLGLLQAGMLYFDFGNPHDQDKFERNFKDLVGHIGGLGKCSSHDPERKESRQVALPVEEWSVEQVHDWAVELNLKREMVQDMDGKSLAFLRKIKNSAPLIFYKYATGQIHSSQFQDFMKLHNAIADLDT